MRNVLMRSGLIAALLMTPAGNAQTPGTANQNFRVAPQAALSVSAVDRNALILARRRPQALQLRAALARLPAQRVDLAVLDRVKLPVLVNPRAEFIANLKVFSSSDHYTASTRRGGMVVEINGTRLPRAAPANFRLPPDLKMIPLNTAPQNAPAPTGKKTGALKWHNALQLKNGVLLPGGTPAGPPPADALRDVNVQRTSYGVDVTFTRFGSVYNLTLDCGAEAKDPEAIGPSGAAPSPADASCSEDAALGLAQELEVAGGGQP